MRYPGGKSRAVKLILSYFPKHISRVCSPFLGGGSIELVLAQKGVEVYAYDYFKPLIEFWQELLEHPRQLAKSIRRYYPLSKKKFCSLQKEYSSIKTKQERAAIFFVLNRASFSGATFRGGMSPGHPRFTKRCIEQLAGFSIHYLHVQYMDFKESIAKHTNDFLYLDPPYYSKATLYGSPDNDDRFDHVSLASILKKRKRWLLSYNNCAYIRKLYQGYQIIPLQWNME